MDFVNITREVERAVEESGVREGLCLVNSMHITSSVFINDAESGLHEDYKRWRRPAGGRRAVALLRPGWNRAGITDDLDGGTRRARGSRSSTEMEG